MTPFKVALIAAAAVTGGFLTAGAVVAQSSDLPDAPGKDIVINSCTACHGIDVMTRRSPDEWGQVVDRMIGNGASLTDDQYKTVVAYLSTNLAPLPAAAPDAAPAETPAH
jgi:cytochrome c5